MSTSISLNYVDGEQYQNKHILNWDNYSYTNLSDPTWTNTLGPNPDWTEETVLQTTQVVKKGRWSVFEYNETSTGNRNPTQWQSAKPPQHLVVINQEVKILIIIILETMVELEIII